MGKHGSKWKPPAGDKPWGWTYWVTDTITTKQTNKKEDTVVNHFIQNHLKAIQPLLYFTLLTFWNMLKEMKEKKISIELESFRLCFCVQNSSCQYCCAVIWIYAAVHDLLSSCKLERMLYHHTVLCNLPHCNRALCDCIKAATTSWSRRVMADTHIHTHKHIYTTYTYREAFLSFSIVFMVPL